MSSAFDPYYEWLGIAPKDQPPNHYRLLGLDTFEPNPEAIVNAAEQRAMILRTRQMGKHSEVSQRLLNEVSAARVILIQVDKKANYDDALRQKLMATKEADANGTSLPSVSPEPRSPATFASPVSHATLPNRDNSPPFTILSTDWGNPLVLIGVPLAGGLMFVACSIGVAVLIRGLFFGKPTDSIATRPSAPIGSSGGPSGNPNPPVGTNGGNTKRPVAKPTTKPENKLPLAVDPGLPKVGPPVPAIPLPPAIGPLHAPVVSSNDLAKAIDILDKRFQAFEKGFETADDETKKTLQKDFYTACAELARARTFVDPEGSMVNERIGRAEGTVSSFHAVPGLADRVGRLSGFWIRKDRKNLDGVLLAGDVQEIRPAGRYFETRVALKDTMPPAAGQMRQVVSVLSIADPKGRYQVGSEVFVLGALVLDPQANLVGYKGDEPQVIWRGSVVLISEQ